MNLNNRIFKLKKAIKKTFTNGLRSSTTVDMIEKMKSQNHESVILDVRSNQEYKEGHLNGAICIPLFELEGTINKYIPDKNKLIIVYCQSGARSKRAVKILEKLGYTNIFEIEGGLDNLQ